MCRWPVLILILVANTLFAADSAPNKNNPIPYKSTYHEVYQEGKRLTEAATAEEAQKVASSWEKLSKKKGSTTVKGPFYRFSQSASELTKLIYEISKNPDYAWLRDWLAPLMDPFTVPEGQLTFDSEGTEGGRYHTRKPHVPPVGQSGITIGRGYDIGQRTDKDKVKEELMSIGLTKEQAEAYAGATGLKRDDAEEYLEKNKDKLVELTPEQQNKLFQITYARYRDGSPGIKGAKAILKDRYGVGDWEKLDPTMREILVDMNYRGDLNRDGTTEQLKDAVKNNDLTKFYKAVADKDFWFPDHKSSKDKYGIGRYSLDPNRFNKRVQQLKKAGVLLTVSDLPNVSVPPEGPFTVPEGQFTFGVEGTEGGRNHTRKPHVPPAGQSGLTVGRGYDIGQRKNKNQVKKDFLAIGLTEEQAEAYAGAVEKKRGDAEAYLEKNKDKLVELTPEQQNKLFQIVYPRYRDGGPEIKGAKEILKDRYGISDWDKLDPTMRTILIDLNFRGELNLDKTTEQLKDAVKNNDLTKFSNAIADKDFWFPNHKSSKDKYGIGRYGLDPNRFNERQRLLKNALGIK